MTSLDSKAAFRARAEELELEDGVLKKLEAAKLDSFGSLAFIGPLQAGNADEQCLIDALKAALGADPSAPTLRIMRRLWFEATTQALTEMRNKVERTDASEPIRMPLAERTQRVEALKARLVGVHWSVDVEPSHKLQDKVSQMISDQALLWLPWEQLTSRSMEITAEKADNLVSFDASGVLKIVKRLPEATCPQAGEYSVRLALQRRSLAFELAKVCRFEYLEAWHELLLQVHMRPQPAGFQRVSMAQLREADKSLFLKISEDTRGALSLRADGTFPFEVSLAKWKDHTQVQYHLVPTLQGRSPNGPGSGQQPKKPEKRKNAPGAQPDSKQARKDDKKEDKSSGQKQWSVPDGCHSRDSKGKPLCFSYNQKGCSYAKAGKRCRRGVHLCWKCLGEHPAYECPEFQ